MKPYILQVCKYVPLETPTSAEQHYDERIQCWIDSKTDDPVVVRFAGSASKFGETTMTETREGADQSEIASFVASKFGETTLTRTTEGIDQSEVTDGGLTDCPNVAYSHF